MNITHILNKPEQKEQKRIAERKRYFEKLQEYDRQRQNPFYNRVSNAHQKILNDPMKTPPSSPNKVRNFKIKRTPGGSNVVGKWRVPKTSGSPIKTLNGTPLPARKLNFNSNPSSRQTSWGKESMNGPLNSYKNGGVVRATGPAKLHKGELVIPKSQIAMVRRAIRMYKRRTSGKK